MPPMLPKPTTRSSAQSLMAARLISTGPTQEPRSLLKIVQSNTQTRSANLPTLSSLETFLSTLVRMLSLTTSKAMAPSWVSVFPPTERLVSQRASAMSPSPPSMKQRLLSKVSRVPTSKVVLSVSITANHATPTVTLAVEVASEVVVEAVAEVASTIEAEAASVVVVVVELLAVVAEAGLAHEVASLTLPTEVASATSRDQRSRSTEPAAQ